MKKRIVPLLAFCLALTLAGCGGSGGSSGASAGSAVAGKKEGSIYYLNFKPEVADVYQKVAAAYTEATGVELRVVTAASGTYEQTLKSEMAKSDAPTLFQINGPLGYLNWQDYCADLSDTQLYQHLNDPSLAVTSKDGVYGIPYVVEGYGILYNEAILRKYFAMTGAKAASVDEINNFEKLQEVVEDMTAKKEQLGIDGVFASTSLKPGEDWRWQTHLANIPLSYEWSRSNVDLTGDATREIAFFYSENYKKIFDLYLNNSTVDRKLLGTRQVMDSMAEFALGRCAMVQNGNWAWNDIKGVDGNTVGEEDVKFLPVYTGMDGEENQGLCIGTENFFCINAKASENDQKLAADFIYWLFSSDTGKKLVKEDLGFIAPFDTFSADEYPEDPLAREVADWMNKEGIQNIPWNFTLFPGQTFKDHFGGALLQYAQGNMEWADVVTQVVDDWKTESANRTV
ncbi:MAG: ABC transporter substrate-binding protein [Oscillospiraceae bacterium]|nr:ABC transporter substrate-binding protein [Oscillospiraceae bacterium]